ncbi:MAG: (2Fe-2S)-binding protein [Gammaproteobacteria bacterium]|nr:(2Fe-2S)-binding protein [Gammaproteobacteria bacterium]NND37211.1 (2Fe-2S)-binding protein [Gammaproteobacteria bacterium]
MTVAKRMMSLTVNGDRYDILVSPRQTLLDVIREQVGLTGTKEGCATGTCGVCTINNDKGEALLSCITPALEWDGKSITTIEGLEHDGKLADIQHAFVEYGAVQCGFCTPGVIMSANSVIQSVITSGGVPTEEQINDGMAGVLCRCTGHIKVKEAIRNVTRTKGGG